MQKLCLDEEQKEGEKKQGSAESDENSYDDILL